MDFPEKIKNAVREFSQLPGIGEKTALRQVLYLSKWSKESISSFSDSLSDLANLLSCKECGLFSDEEVCSICLSSDRKNAKSLCVVENITDCLAIEKSSSFKGLYHVLGGVLNPLLGIGPENLKLNYLRERVIDLGVEEIVLALNPSVEGDATCAYIKNFIPISVKIDRIGFGIPIGGSLEYLDSRTISTALENRKMM